MVNGANSYQQNQPLLLKPPLNVGIIGAGLMGYWHAVTAQRIGGKIVAILDLDIHKADLLAQRFTPAQAFSDFTQMLKQSQLQVLHICTPLATHQYLAELAIEAGLHLLIEKPLVIDALATEKLYEYATKQAVSICPVHQFLFQRGVLQAKQALTKLGELIHIESVICSAGGIGKVGQSLIDTVAEILPHPLSLMEAFLPTGLPTDHWQKFQPRDGELRAWGQTASGTTLSLFISMNARPTSCQLTLVGTQGTIYLDLFHGYSFYQPGTVSKINKIWLPFDISRRRLWAAASNLSSRIIYRELAYPGLAQLIDSFYQSLTSSKPLPILPEEVLAVARIRDSLIS